MNNIAKIILTLAVICIAIAGVFHLIFPTFVALEALCSLTGILFASTVFFNLWSVTSSVRMPVRVVSRNIVIYIILGLSFLWTLLFTFVSDDWAAPDRNLKTLYIGYLILLIVGSTVWLIADFGGSAAQSKSDSVQSLIAEREQLLVLIDRIMLVTDSWNNGAKSEANRILSESKSHLRAVPAGKLKDTTACADIKVSLSALQSAVESADIATIKETNLKLINKLKSL